MILRRDALTKLQKSAVDCFNSQTLPGVFCLPPVYFVEGVNVDVQQGGVPTADQAARRFLLQNFFISSPLIKWGIGHRRE